MGINCWLKRIHLFLAGLILGTTLYGCVTTEIPLLVSDKQPPPLERWKAYGACYEYDELRVTINELNQYYEPGAKYAVNQKIDILSKKGVDRGTFEVHRFTENCSLFNIRLIGPDGKEIDLDLPSIKKKYIDTGKIVLPQVVPGCQIFVKIHFLGNKYLHSYEHWFLRSIPVLKSRFAFLKPVEFTYKTAAYGGIQLSEQVSPGKGYGFVWEAQNLLPEGDVTRYGWQRYLEPRVLLRLTNVIDRSLAWEADGWKGISKDYKAFLMSPSFFTLRPLIKNRVMEIVGSANDKREQVQKILEYVRNEITLVDVNTILQPVDIHEILRDKKADRWEKAVMLKEMLESIGFPVRVYLSRSRKYGGFDPDIPTWRQLRKPVVATVIAGKEQILDYLYKGAAIGEYPFIYYPPKALDLRSGKIVSLPEPLHRIYEISTHAAISLDNWDQPHEWTFTYGGYAGMIMRKKFKYASRNKQKDILESKLGKYDDLNELSAFDLEGLDKWDDIKATIQVKTGGFKTGRSKKVHYALAPWYKKYFTKYGKDVKTGYANGVEDVYRESLLIKTSGNKKLTVHYECQPMENDLFSVACSQEKTNEGIVLNRRLRIKTAILDAEQMTAFLPHIDKLNRIKESYVVEQSGQ